MLVRTNEIVTQQFFQRTFSGQSNLNQLYYRLYQLKHESKAESQRQIQDTLRSAINASFHQIALFQHPNNLFFNDCMDYVFFKINNL